MPTDHFCRVLYPEHRRRPLRDLDVPASNFDKPRFRFLTRPHMVQQHLTTSELSLGVIEVAVVSFKRALLSEGILHVEQAENPEPRLEPALSYENA